MTKNVLIDNHYKTIHRPRIWCPTSAETHIHVGKILAAMLAIKRSVGVTPEVNLRVGTSCMPLPSAKKAAHSGFEIQRRCHQKSKTGHVSTKNFKKIFTDQSEMSALPVWCGTEIHTWEHKKVYTRKQEVIMQSAICINLQ